MDGIQINKTKLFLGRISGRKSLCFWFEEGPEIWPVAYVSKKLEPKAVEYWSKMLEELSARL